MSKNTNQLEHLRQQARRALHMINKEALPSLAKHIDEDTAFEQTEDVIVHLCATEGMSVQTAMSILDSEYGNKSLEEE